MNPNEEPTTKAPEASDDTNNPVTSVESASTPIPVTDNSVETTNIEPQVDPTPEVTVPISPSTTIPAETAQDTQPVPSEFTPFKKPRNKRRYILVVILLGVIAAVAVYVIWNFIQPTDSTQQDAQTSLTTNGNQEAIAPIEDTEASISTEVVDIEKDINDLDDSAYADSTLANDTIYSSN